MEQDSDFTRLKAISKAYPVAWEEMVTEIGHTEDTTLVAEWLYRQGCDWDTRLTKDGWIVNWRYQPEGRVNAAVAEWKSIETGSEAFLHVLEQSFRAVDLHLRPPQDFMDSFTVAQAAREKRKQYFKDKKK